MDRSKFILAKDCDAVKPEMRGLCCDSLMFVINDYDQVNCEKYGYRSEWGKYANIFQKNMMKCCYFKRDGDCPVANLIEKEKAEEKRQREVAEKIAREEREEKEAAEKIRRAAEQGDADAQKDLGLLYLDGKGVPKDCEKAAEWFGKAAAQGHGEAKDWLTKAEAAIEEEKARKVKEAKEKAAKAKEAAKKEAKKAVLPLALGGIIGGLLLLFFPQIVVGGFLGPGPGSYVLLFVLVIGDALLAAKLFGGCLSVIIGIIIGFIAWIVLFALFFFIKEINIPSVYRLVSTVSGAVIGALIGLLVKTIVKEW